MTALCSRPTLQWHATEQTSDRQHCGCCLAHAQPMNESIITFLDHGLLDGPSLDLVTISTKVS